MFGDSGYGELKFGEMKSLDKFWSSPSYDFVYLFRAQPLDTGSVKLFQLEFICVLYFKCLERDGNRGPRPASVILIGLDWIGLECRIKTRNCY